MGPGTGMAKGKMFFRQKSKTDSLDDLQLVQQYKATGDLAVLGALYDRYMDLVYGVCLKYLKDREASQDATMQLFEKLVKTLRQHEVGNFKSWLYVMAKNHCLMQLRSQKRQFSDVNLEGVMENGYQLHHEVEAESELEENLVKLEGCIEQLQEEQKVCVGLFYLGKKPYKSIATETGMPLGKVKSHIQNGKRNLKICMEAN